MDRWDAQRTWNWMWKVKGVRKVNVVDEMIEDGAGMWLIEVWNGVLKEWTGRNV